MSFDPPGKVNPFEAPRAGIGGYVSDLEPSDLADAELTRRTYLNHEASVKAVGSLQYLGAIIWALVMIACFAAAAGQFNMNLNQPGLTPEQMQIVYAGMGVFFFFLLLINAGIGYGLRNLQGWARWVMMVLMSLALLSVVSRIVIAAASDANRAIAILGPSAIPFLIYGYILYLVASSKGGVVFSRDYKEVIRKTPHIKYKISIIVKILLGLLLFVLLLALVGGLMAFLGTRK